MFTRSVFPSKWPFFAAIAAVWIAGFFKIADLDFWWHLKTGQLILSQRSFQHHEIYSFTAQGREYVDHEWLFQVLQYLAYAAGSIPGIIVLKCLVLSALYLLLARHLMKQKVSPWVSVVILTLSVCGARTRFIERPEVYSALFLVAVYLVLDDFLKNNRRKWLWVLPLLFVLWSNIHAAVILGLVVQLFFIMNVALEQLLMKTDYPTFYTSNRKNLVVLFLIFASSLISTGLNPTGYRVLMVPFELTALIDSGLLQNQEWQQPPVLRLPFYYVCLFFAFTITILNFRRLRFAPFFLAAFLGYISLKYVRNVGLFCMLMPLMIAPYPGALHSILGSWKIAAPVTAALIAAIPLTSPFQPGTGIASYFPDKIVEFTTSRNLQGNLLNSYAFGGYLIWTLYPERKIFIDGRNEVYLPLLEEIVRVRADEREWKKFLEKYRIEYALLNYVDDLEEVTVMDPERGPIKTYAPFSSNHFSRASWALVYWDDDGMIFVKRNGINNNVVGLEYTNVFPEGHSYQESLARAGRIDRDRAIEELKRKLTEDPHCKRAAFMLRMLEALPRRK